MISEILFIVALNTYNLLDQYSTHSYINIYIQFYEQEAVTTQHKDGTSTPNEWKNPLFRKREQQNTKILPLPPLKLCYPCYHL